MVARKVPHTQAKKSNWSGLGIATAGLLLTFVLLLIIAYRAPTEMSVEHAPKMGYAMFGFATAMLATLFVDKEGIRAPSRREVGRKLPAILLSLLLCLAVLGWMDQLKAYETESKKLEAACRIMRNETRRDEFGALDRDRRSRAESEAIAAAHRIAALKVRHPSISEDTPCD